MKNFILFASSLCMVACSSANHNPRSIASVEKDLTGTYLGVSDYGRGHKGLDKAASRIYFHPIRGQTGKYNVVLLEYVNLLKMAPSYIASNKLPFIARKTGFLKNITSKIVAYEAVPGTKAGTYEMRPLVVMGDRIDVRPNAAPRILTLSDDARTENPLEGATISKVREDDPQEIFFPKDDDEKKNGLQYGLAKLAYEKAKLESTWRESFLDGSYFSQYYNREDVVLKLRQDLSAEFILNPKYAKMQESKRRKMFTNEKSAFLRGDFTASSPRDGMFLFHVRNADKKTNNIVKGRIGLFIDIFDATKSLNQDVVELALIDSENPEDFLMYYEDPDNGEGAGGSPRK